MLGRLLGKNKALLTVVELGICRVVMAAVYKALDAGIKESRHAAFREDDKYRVLRDLGKFRVLARNMKEELDDADVEMKDDEDTGDFDGKR